MAAGDRVRRVISQPWLSPLCGQVLLQTRWRAGAGMGAPLQHITRHIQAGPSTGRAGYYAMSFTGTFKRDGGPQTDDGKI